MSIQTKLRFKNIGRIVGGLIFALLLFTNIKVAFMDDVELVSGDISLMGIELTLFEATYANEGGGGENVYHFMYYRSSSCPSGFKVGCDLDGTTCQSYTNPAICLL
jgi:hypothetical protein